MFCSSKPFKRRQIGGKNIPKRLNETILPMDPPFLADDTENGTSLLNNGNIYLFLSWWYSFLAVRLIQCLDLTVRN